MAPVITPASTPSCSDASSAVTTGAIVIMTDTDDRNCVALVAVPMASVTVACAKTRHAWVGVACSDAALEPGDTRKSHTCSWHAQATFS